MGLNAQQHSWPQELQVREYVTELDVATLHLLRREVVDLQTARVDDSA